MASQTPTFSRPVPADDDVTEPKNQYRSPFQSTIPGRQAAPVSNKSGQQRDHRKLSHLMRVRRIQAAGSPSLSQHPEPLRTTGQNTTFFLGASGSINRPCTTQAVEEQMRCFPPSRAPSRSPHPSPSPSPVAPFNAKTRWLATSRRAVRVVLSRPHWPSRGTGGAGPARARDARIRGATSQGMRKPTEPSCGLWHLLHHCAAGGCFARASWSPGW